MSGESSYDHRSSPNDRERKSLLQARMRAKSAAIYDASGKPSAILLCGFSQKRGDLGRRSDRLNFIKKTSLAYPSRVATSYVRRNDPCFVIVGLTS
ncbi:MAG: hypothetical protein LBU73_07840 [Helicobacteraceae bacterium]|jgi:hypothetical protein|nr:hypothetical protein [Helicobacteraceae bacterium]